MPILPENLARYPANWAAEVVPRIRRRSGDRCECTGQCGKHQGRCNAVNGCVGYWKVPGTFTFYTTNREAQAKVEVPRGMLRIVLTVMHLDHQPENCEDANLLHGCQLCHNSYDLPHRLETKRSRRAAGDLFEEKPHGQG